jgi:hypothetical protein
MKTIGSWETRKHGTHNYYATNDKSMVYYAFTTSHSAAKCAVCKKKLCEKGFIVEDATGRKDYGQVCSLSCGTILIKNKNKGE